MRSAANTASVAMVLYWRDRNASAPSRMASEILRISGFPVSAASTCLARRAATTSDSTLIPRTSGRTVPASMNLLQRSIGTGRGRATADGDVAPSFIEGTVDGPVNAGDYLS